MRHLVPAAIVLGFARDARADIFAFKDREGFERCMQVDHLVESVKTGSGYQSRYVSHVEIQRRCIDRAVTLLSGTKNKDVIFDFVKATKRLSAPQNALPLIDVLADASLAACNEIEVYEVLLRPLADPPDGDYGYFGRAKRIIKRCLKDKDFRKDFVDEKDSDNPAVAAAACQILIEEKLVNTCKGRP